MGWLEWLWVAGGAYLLWQGAKAVDRYEDRLRAVERELAEMRMRNK